MTAYIDTVSGEFPLYEGDIRLRHLNVSFPSNFVPPEQYQQIEMAVPPDLPWNKVFEHGKAEFIDGKWRQKWSVREATEEERAALLADKWREVRMIRNSRLASSDWTQLPDAPLSIEARQAWAEYRAALRDITKSASPFQIEWPSAAGTK